MPKYNQELAAAMGKRIFERRKELDLTQEYVAEAAGLSHQQYNRVEKGKACLSSHTLERVSSVLGISADYLLTGQKEDRYRETVSVLEKMSDRQLQVANRVLQELIDFSNTEKPSKNK